MKLFVTVVAAAFVLCACQSTTEAPMSVKAPETAIAPLVGKSLSTNDGSTIILNADGTVSGTNKGRNIVGTYVATPTEICSTYSEPEPWTGKEFCSKPDIQGDTVTFHRRDGSKSATYKIGG